MGKLVTVCVITSIFCLLICGVCSEDYTEDDEMIISLILQDNTQPESGREPSADFYRCQKDAWRIPGQYIVMLREGTHESQVERTIRRLRAKAAKRGYLIEVLRTFSGAFHGILVKMSSDVLDLAVKLPHVKYIEEDSFIFAQGIPWNLDRIVLTKHAAGKYSPPNDGEQVEVYLLDTSVQSNHREIEGRVLITDFNSVPEEDGVRVHRQASKCDSHGTHTAGVVSGQGSGVARGSSIRSVRVLNCQGKGTVSGALAGLEYVRASVLAQPYSPLIVLLPFTGGFSRTLNTACREMVSNGAILIAAAGNYYDDACLYSPASEPQVITVGATDLADQPMHMGTLGTNYGRCVDLFAPGDNIVSASSDCPTCFTAKSGTSQAAAHVAGIAAVILNSNPSLTSTETLHQLLQNSVKHAMDSSAFPEEYRLATPNMVAGLPPSMPKGGGLMCRSVWSPKSGSSSSDTSSARCRAGEEMFSCSSFSPSGVRSGDTVHQERDGQKECVAYNAYGGQGVYAIARCCTWEGVHCEVRSSQQEGEQVECPSSDHHLTGCGSHSVSGVAVDRVRPLHGDQKACSATAGVRSHALCCQAPSLECRLKEHSSSGSWEQVEVSCEEGWTLTGCNALSQGTVTHGAYARWNTCLVKGSGERNGVTVVATCCRQKKASEQPKSKQ